MLSTAGRKTSNLGRQKLKSDGAPELHIERFVNHTHAAGADFLDNAVMRDGFANHMAGKD
jgi:hypothetical protein